MSFYKKNGILEVLKFCPIQTNKKNRYFFC